MRTSFFIDGFNLYHALDGDPSYRRYKWLSLSRLCSAYTDPGDSIEGIFYFTALAFWDRVRLARHRRFIQAQEHEGVKIVYGEFKQRDKFCPRCRQWYQTHEEKQTDVNIALQLFHHAVANNYEKAVLISGDSDLAPAIQVVQDAYPAKVIGAVIPIGRRADRLKTVSSFHRKMKALHLRNSRLADQIILRDGSLLQCPGSWR